MLANLGLAALPLQSQMPQKARLRSLERFAGPPRPGGKPAKTAAVLVATDVAARGLDITNVDLVVHYHVPRSADAYVHRSGRTARAEKSGLSILLCSPDEVTPLRRLVAKVHATAQAKAARAEKSGTSKAGKKEKTEGGFFIHKIDLDRTFVARIRERVLLAKKVADAELAKEKSRSEDSQLKQAAEDLGVDYDSDEMDKVAGRWRGRGGGKKQKQKELKALTKRDMAALKAQLRDLLSERINLGVSEKYIASGQIAMSKLVGDTRFLGDPASVGFDL
jgi:ATP-dependent RNA helicase DDX24/MAK5